MPAATVVRDGLRADRALVPAPLPASPLVRIRPWRPGDERLIARAADQLSPASLRSRFLAGVPRLPETYLRRLATLPPDAWGAQVALRADRCAEQVVGWAEFVRFATPIDGTVAAGSPPPGSRSGGFPAGAPGNAEADLAILVLDAWQRRGVGRALIGALVRGAVADGVHTLHADLHPGNGAARGLLASVLGRDRLTARVVDGLLHYTVRLANQ